MGLFTLGDLAPVNTVFENCQKYMTFMSSFYYGVAGGGGGGEAVQLFLK